MTNKYYKLSAEKIFDDVIAENCKHGKIDDIDLVIFPHVYPSHKFRTTSFVLKSIIDLIKDANVCDMGCGPGIVGLFSMKNGAKKVVQADINPYAVENAKENIKNHELQNKPIEVYESNCFDNVPRQTFDLIVFNMPYHSEDIKITDPLQRAFYDPLFISISKFLRQVPDYSHQKTKITIAFSNKGDTTTLEKIFTDLGYNWDLWKVTNTDQKYDNRIYLLSL